VKADLAIETIWLFSPRAPFHGFSTDFGKSGISCFLPTSSRFHFEGWSIRHALRSNGRRLSGDGLLMLRKITGPIVASASLGTFGCTGRMTDPVRVRFGQAPQLCQKRGKVASVKQRLLAELNALEVASFDRFVERSATDTE
jgi:hypothetical protein